MKFLRDGGAVFAALALATLLAGTMGAAAGPVADSAAQAETLLGSGKPADALAAYDQATDAFWSASPLQFRKIIFADAVSGYGRYTAHAGSGYKAGDTPVIYFEPVGYGFGTSADGARIAFSTGLEIKTPGGLILAQTSDLADLEWTGATRTHEFYGAVSVALPASLKPGAYQLILTITDTISRKTTTATLPFDVGA
jgi:hypothetical protein